MKKRLGFSILILGVLALTITSVLWYFKDTPLLSPITSSTTFQFLTGHEQSKTGLKKIVYGFVPYWNLSKVTLQPELTHFAYFGLTIGSDGKVVTKSDEGTEPGYQRLGSETNLDLMTQVKKQKGNVEVVFTQFNNDDTVAFLTSTKAHQNFLDSLDAILLAYPVDGINLDIEYTGEVTPQLRSSFTAFVTKVSDHLKKKYDHVQLSIDVYASAASKANIWEVEKIAPEVDYVVVMAYDFHRRSSPAAGPVAPLFGGKRLWDSDITQHLRDLIAIIPKSKILLGVPFYGYEWQTTSRDAQAHTFPETGSTATIERVNELLKNKTELKVEQHWNEDALSPYLSYQKNGHTYVIYYEDSRSISYKLDLVNQLELGGVAIWALGYESNSRELWDVVHRKI